jgi:predicted PhzF superfamily epimerase YddE/YHI9
MYLSFRVNTFANHRFAGNSAAVSPLNQWLDDEVLRLVAAENNVSETAYFAVLAPRGEFLL